jgi:DnaJ-class molecular chaperone
MDRDTVRKKQHPAQYVTRVEEDRGIKKEQQEPEICKDCMGWGTQTNGFDGHPERCKTCDGIGEL